MSRPYTHRDGPYQDPTLYDDDANGTASNGTQGYGASQASYNYDNQSARNEYGRPAHQYQRGATNAPYPAQSYPGAPSYDRGSREHSSEAHAGHDGGRGGSARRRYTDRDREGYQSDHDEKGTGNTPPSHGGNSSNPPSRTLILEGLPFEMTQEDILNELRTNFHALNLEEVRLIKDKRTGLSRQFAFAQFTALADAKSFYDQNPPFIQFKGIYGDGGQGEDLHPHVTIAYSREKDERPLPGQGGNDWICEVCTLVNYATRTICFKCHAPRTQDSIMTKHGMPVGISKWSGFATHGDTDVSYTPSQYLLFRKLDAGVTEELLAKAVTKLYRNAPSPPAAEDSPNKKPKIASTTRETHFGAKEGSLRRVLLVKDRVKDESWKFGFAEFATVDDATAAMQKYAASEEFTIKSKPVMVSYIHSGVFKPVMHMTYPVEDKFTIGALHDPAVKFIYWDEGGYCSELVVEKEKTDLEKMKAKVDEATKRARVSAADRGLLGPPTEKTIAASKKRKAHKEKENDTTSGSKPVQAHVFRWEKSKAEIHGAVAPVAESGVAAGSMNGTASTSEAADNKTQAQQTFRKKMKVGTPDEMICCLLCKRQFKGLQQIEKHELGNMHREKLQDADLIKKTLETYPQLKPQTSEQDGGDTYVDRAALRRQQFAQPKQPQGQQRKAPTPEPEESLKPAENKGSKMLEKMGWTAGQGLGAEGTGRTEAIATELYAQGVGLGAVGGKVGDAVEEANKATGSTYQDFLQRGKDKARERFEEID